MRTILALALLALPTALADVAGPYALDSTATSCGASAPLHATTCLAVAHVGGIAVAACEPEACLLDVRLAASASSDTPGAKRLTACVTYANAQTCARDPFADLCLDCPPQPPFLLCEDTTTGLALDCTRDALVRFYVRPGWCTHLSVVTAIHEEKLLGRSHSTGGDGENSFGLCRDDEGAPIFTPYWAPGEP